MEFPIAITFGQEENYLLSREVFFLKTCLSSVNVVDYVSFLKLSLERLDDFCFDGPVLITNDAVRDFRLLNADVSDNRNLSVIAAKIAEGRPLLVVLGQHTNRQNQKNDEDFEQ